MAVSLPALAQQPQEDKEDYVAIWLVGGRPGREAAGVVVRKAVVRSRNVLPELRTLEGFIKFSMANATFLVVSPTASIEDSSTAQTQISAYNPISTRIDARQELLAGRSKVGKQTVKAYVTGMLALVDGGAALLPVEGAYTVGGTIVTSYTGSGKPEDVAKITGTVLGLLNRKLALGLSASIGGGQEATYVMPDFVTVALRGDVYRGPLYRDDNFGWFWRGAKDAQYSEYVKSAYAKVVKGDMGGAIADYNNALQLKPNSADANVYTNRGSARAATGDLDGAIADATKALELDRRFADAYHVRGTARQAKGDTDGAIADFATGLVYASENERSKFSAPLAFNYRSSGSAKASKGDLDGAISDFTKAIVFYPDFADAYYDRSTAKRAKGDVDGADADRAKAIQIKPDLARQ